MELEHTLDVKSKTQHLYGKQLALLWNSYLQQDLKSKTFRQTPLPKKLHAVRSTKSQNKSAGFDFAKRQQTRLIFDGITKQPGKGNRKPL